DQIFSETPQPDEIHHNFFDRRNIGPAYEAGKDFFKINSKQSIGGFSCSEFSSLDDIYELIHPQDLSFVIDYAVKAVEFANTQMDNVLSCNGQLIFRIVGKDRREYTVCRKSFVSGAINNKITRNVSFYSDVTWMRASPKSWCLMGDNSQYFDLKFQEVELFKDIFSTREVEVLRLLARGFHSRDIAEALKISRHTVDTHRKNMLRKVDVANTPELLTLSRDMNLI
ncbi:MAG: helix-turn-helix transcriptional regulator, partial [Ekhidna sp.]